jgi:hypothetical protein
MGLRVCMGVFLLFASTTAAAQLLGCNRRLGWTIDGEHCPRCDIVFGGAVAKKQSFGVCLECSAGCPYEKAALPPKPDEQSPSRSAENPPFKLCGLLEQPSKLLAPAEEMPVVLRVEHDAIGDMSRRYPIAATFLALMSSGVDAPSIFNAGSVTMGIRHQPRAVTGLAFLERGDAAMQAPFVTELPLFEQVLVEVRGERLSSGDIGWWVLSSLETKKGTRVLEGPVRIVLADTGARAAASVGNIGIVAPVVTVASVE